MPEYRAPLEDMMFVLNSIAGMNDLFELPAYQDFDAGLVAEIMGESAKFCSEVLSPLNKVGDRQSSTFKDGEVMTPTGWVEAYSAFVDSGWNSLAFDPQSGGQGLPWLVATAVQEMWHSANMSFGLCPLLTQGAVRALELHGSQEQKDVYLENLVSGKWCGTMNLTESQAGSDLSAIRTSAVQENGHYRIRGQKIFITYGEHDLAENIIHFVLARASDSPDGVKGISLFIVPKVLVDNDGTLGERNDVRCVSIERKLGIHASPTAVMSYGDNGGAIGYLVGEKNRGLEYMFTMMNLARHAVGVEGLAIGERAYQQALDYAKQRIQGASPSTRERVAIINHPDVRRMLMTMKSMNEAMRCLAYYTSGIFDKSTKHEDSEMRVSYELELGILIPVVKGLCAELGNEVAYLGLQVHGGMGYIEETGAAQHLRDARITPIYEGTTGIQANDLVNRKILKDEGEYIQSFIKGINASLRQMKAEGQTASIFSATLASLDHLVRATEWVIENGASSPPVAAATSVSYMHILGYVVCGWLLCKSTNAAEKQYGDEGANKAFLEAKMATAEYYATHILPRAQACADAVVNSSNLVFALSDDQF